MQEEKSQYRGPAARTDYRILGWCRRRIRMNPGQVWFRFNAAEFHDSTGVSLRSIRYALNRLRAQEGPLEFRTLFDRSIGKRGAWVVLYADPSRLKFDREPLHRDRAGKPRHVRRQLSVPKDEIPPTFSRKDESHGFVSRSGSRSGSRSTMDQGGEVSATPIEGRDTSYLSRVETPPRTGRGGVFALERFAAAMARRLEREHWDNCKVDWEFVAVRDFCLRWCREGFEEEEIRRAYDRHLHQMHMMATDLGLNEGNPRKRFRPTSTVKRASATLARIAKQTTRGERVRRFYRNRNALRAKVRSELEKALAA